MCTIRTKTHCIILLARVIRDNQKVNNYRDAREK